MSRKNILITGLPGKGKTTLIRKVAERLPLLHPAGFFTAEMREQGVRKGFELASFDGKRGILSHAAISSSHRVGKYGVDVAGFEAFLESLRLQEGTHRLILIDEVGKMECLSHQFKQVVTQLFDSDKLVVATVALKGDAFIEQLKQRPDVRLITVTERNRNALVGELVQELTAWMNSLSPGPS